MSTAAQEDENKSKRPSSSAFKQQRLPAWQPILTAGTVLPTFFVIGIAFIPIGIGLLYFSNDVMEFSLDYTYCNSTKIKENGTAKTCASVIEANINQHCECELKFTISKPFEHDVYMYYGLTNYYQNHRRYVKSRDDSQLLGHLEFPPSTDCIPFQYVQEPNNHSAQLPIAPCGAIANSLFNDTFELTSSLHDKVTLLHTGIAWPSDKDIKFRNPPGNVTSGEAFKGYAKPIYWKEPVWRLEPENPENNGFQNEDLIVWMRTAALPDFRKLYRRIDHSQEGFRRGIPADNYTLTVKYAYPVVSFGGSKRMILSTTSLLGGKNPFLGIAYIVVGCICLLMGIVFLLIHIKCGKSTTEMINVTPRTPF